MLQAGQVFKLGGKTYRVLYVNASRAHCVTEEKQPVTMREFNRRTGQYVTRSFIGTVRSTIDISPDSILGLC